jgi:hypothetical protein
VGLSLTSGPCTTLAHLSMGLARSAPVKNKNRGRLDGQDQAGHPNPTVRTTSESQGSWRLYFDGCGISFMDYKIIKHNIIRLYDMKISAIVITSSTERLVIGNQHISFE